MKKTSLSRLCIWALLVLFVCSLLPWEVLAQNKNRPPPPATVKPAPGAPIRPWRPTYTAPPSYKVPEKSSSGHRLDYHVKQPAPTSGTTGNKTLGTGSSGKSAKPYQVSGNGGGGSRAPNVMGGGGGRPPRSTESLVKAIAVRAEKWGVRQGLAPSGEGHVQGTKKHDYAKELLIRYKGIYKNHDHLLAEKSWRATRRAGYGENGSVRLDVYDLKTGITYDYKFTKNPRTISGRREKQIIMNGPPGINKVVPIGAAW